MRDCFIVGINDKTLLTKLINSAVKDPRISLETIVLHAQVYEATRTKLKKMVPDVEGQVNFTNSRSTGPKKSKLVKQDMCPWCAEPAHPNDKTDCHAQGRQCYACCRMNHLSIECKHPNS
ncbi:hypothetical protein LSH36_1827g00003 [Paralvinella palmiformis]|uniref:Uncharacterized protein n=1 Tax=Paralvinella palmiformis TaxID=53620 RepID=A0AAD9ISC8_9ANNE|nr:hypothetical protein LSH36_1827g00003 [Paralvinella palmiformis]